MDAQTTYDAYAPRSPVPAEAVKKAAKAITRKAKAATKPEGRKPKAPAAEDAPAPAEIFTPAETGSADAHGVARDQLRSFVERIERLEEEKATIATDIKDVYGEAKGVGFDVKILRKVVTIRKMDRDERQEQEAILDTYLAALGMIDPPAEG